MKNWFRHLFLCDRPEAALLLALPLRGVWVYSLVPGFLLSLGWSRRLGDSGWPFLVIALSICAVIVYECITAGHGYALLLRRSFPRLAAGWSVAAALAGLLLPGLGFLLCVMPAAWRRKEFGATVCAAVAGVGVWLALVILRFPLVPSRYSWLLLEVFMLPGLAALWLLLRPRRYRWLLPAALLFALIGGEWLLLRYFENLAADGQARLAALAGGPFDVEEYWAAQAAGSEFSGSALDELNRLADQNPWNHWVRNRQTPEELTASLAAFDAAAPGLRPRLHQFAAAPPSVFRHRRDRLYRVKLPELGAYRRTASLFRLELELAAWRGEREEVERINTALVRLRERCWNEGFFIACLVGVAIDAIRIDGWHALLVSGHLSDAELAAGWLPPWYADPRARFIRGVNLELLIDLEGLYESFPDIPQLKRSRLNPLWLQLWAGAEAETMGVYLADLATAIATVTPETARRLFLEFEERYREVPGRGRLFGGILLGGSNGSFRVIGSLAERQTLWRIAVALERCRRARGDWPAELEELVPEFLAAVPVSPYSGLAPEYEVKEEVEVSEGRFLPGCRIAFPAVDRYARPTAFPLIPPSEKK